MSLQRYVSRELTHFVGRGKPEEEQYSLLLKILKSGWLTHPPHDPEAPSRVTKLGNARFSTVEMYSPDVVCFCDIPVEDFAIHMKKYSHFGLAFLKSCLLTKGANPVFYIANNSLIDGSASPLFPALCRIGTTVLVPRSEVFDTLMHEHTAADSRLLDILERIQSTGTGYPGPPSDIELAIVQSCCVKAEFAMRVFSFFKCFDASKDDTHDENFYMEREWRVLGNVQFTLKDVCRVVLPSAFAERLRHDVPDYFGQVTFPE
jgi:hypothetical protein